MSKHRHAGDNRPVLVQTFATSPFELCVVNVLLASTTVSLFNPHSMQHAVGLGVKLHAVVVGVVIFLFALTTMTCFCNWDQDWPAIGTVHSFFSFTDHCTTLRCTSAATPWWCLSMAPALLLPWPMSWNFCNKRTLLCHNAVNSCRWHNAFPARDTNLKGVSTATTTKSDEVVIVIGQSLVLHSLGPKVAHNNGHAIHQRQLRVVIVVHPFIAQLLDDHQIVLIGTVAFLSGTAAGTMESQHATTRGQMAP